MATTAQQVFDAAMNLMDEVNESSGKTDTADTKEYKNRTIAIVNILCAECYPYSDTCVAQPGRRPVCPPVTDFETAIDIDDGICNGVFPYGLASHLLLDEHPDMASFFQQRYEELLGSMARRLPVVAAEIEDLYGGIGLGRFARW